MVVYLGFLKKIGFTSITKLEDFSKFIPNWNSCCSWQIGYIVQIVVQWNLSIFNLHFSLVLCFCHSDVLRSHNRQSWFEVQRFTSTSSVSSSSPRQQITATSTTILLLQLSKSNYLRSKSYNHYTLILRSVRVTYVTDSRKKLFHILKSSTLEVVNFAT